MLSGAALADPAAGASDVTVTCTIAGTMFTRTVSAADVCEPCGEGCLTRGAGFWCTHPLAAEHFLGIESCGITLTNVIPATEGSIVEDLVFGADHRIDDGKGKKEVDTSILGFTEIAPQNLQLIRQCAAAHLNVAATADAVGNCEAAYPGGIRKTLERCCSLEMCTGSAEEITASECIELLDTFNSFSPPGELEFAEDVPGLSPAQPGACRGANGNGFINDRTPDDGSPLAGVTEGNGRPGQLN